LPEKAEEGPDLTKLRRGRGRSIPNTEKGIWVDAPEGNPAHEPTENELRELLQGQQHLGNTCEQRKEKVKR